MRYYPQNFRFLTKYLFLFDKTCLSVSHQLRKMLEEDVGGGCWRWMLEEDVGGGCRMRMSEEKDVTGGSVSRMLAEEEVAGGSVSRMWRRKCQ